MEGHQQHPILSLVSGDATSIGDLEREALEELREVAERHLKSLAGSSSAWIGLLSAVASAGRLQQVPPVVSLAQPESS